MSNPTQPPHDSGSGEREAQEAPAEHPAASSLERHAGTAGASTHASQTPLIDLLRGVPADARLIYEHSPTESQSIPVGTLCAAAATHIHGLTRCVEAYQHTVAKLLEAVSKYGPAPSQAVASALQVPEGPANWAVEWLRNNYQEHDNIASLCDAMLAAAPDHPVVQPGIQGSELQKAWTLEQIHQAMLDAGIDSAAEREEVLALLPKVHQAEASLLLACDSSESGHQARATFERACGFVGAPRREMARGDGGEYCAVRAQGAWDAWQAARALPTPPTNGDAPPSLYKRLADGTYLEATYGEIAEAHKVQGTWPFDGTGEAS